MLKMKNYALLAAFVFLVCLMGLAISQVSRADNAPKPPAAQPFQLPFGGSFSNSSLFTFGLADYTVPNDKRLVIEFASVVARRTSQEGLVLIIHTKVNGTDANHYVNLAKFWDYDYGGSPTPFYVRDDVGSKLVRLYADPGTTVVISARRSSACTNGACPGDFTFEGSISGYLEAP